MLPTPLWPERGYLTGSGYLTRSGASKVLSPVLDDDWDGFATNDSILSGRLPDLGVLSVGRTVE
jgi:hypothetical protein